MLKKSKINGTEKIGLVTPSLDLYYIYLTILTHISLKIQND